MTIKGTLETFNLRELLQMLAFNQKVGTLVLETERGSQTVHVDKGCVAFVEGDERATEALLRVIRRRNLVPEDRLERALRINAASGEYLGQILKDLGALDEAALQGIVDQATGELFLTLQLTAITRFEFADGQVLAPDRSDRWPDGRPRTPIEPGLVVEGLLLDLTRKMDQWAELKQVVPTTSEVYEGTGISVDIAAALADEDVDPALADPVVAALDGYRTLDQVIRASDVDDLSVVQLVGVLVQGGGVRPVATDDLLARGEDLLARGEAQHALPLLRRAVERGDAPPEARIRMADALEATNQRSEAAAELDAFAIRTEDSNPVAVFDALHRALGLRDGDIVTAARLCDYYLNNRPWLLDRHAQAVETLRTLIHGAVTHRQPIEAAQRLQQYINHGDAPKQDLLVLADLYASAGERSEASTALFRRAEDLLTQGRVAPARDLLKRTLQLDPSRADARGRLHMLDGAQRNRRQKKRLVLLLVVLGLVLVGAGAAWWAYNQEAGRAVRKVREDAEEVLVGAEARLDATMNAFLKRLEAAETALEPDPELPGAAKGLLRQVTTELDEVETAVAVFAKELERYSATDHQETNTVVLHHLQSRIRTIRNRAEDVVHNAKKRGQRALQAGETAHASGKFVPAREHLVLARNLAFDDSALASRADLLLRHVTRYIEQFEEAMKPMIAAREAGDVGETFRQGIAIIAFQLDSDLTRTIRLPVELRTTPTGAHVWYAGEETELTTPCTFEYSPFDSVQLTLRMPGRTPHRFDLPSFHDIVESPDAAEQWTPSLTANLPTGTRWRVSSGLGPFRDVWASKSVPVLLLEDGSGLLPVIVDTGSLDTPKSFRRHEPVRTGGTMTGGIEWRLLGQRTLLVRPRGEEPWEVQVLGRLERAPARLGEIVAIVDERGNAYGLDLATGRERWRRALGSPPVQPLFAGPMGFLIGTVGGNALALSSETGQVRKLASAARGRLLAVPLGENALLIGGAAHEARLFTAAGTLRRVGRGSPIDAAPWISPDGVAWINTDGVSWMPVDADASVVVRGLGVEVTSISGDGREMYAVGRDGVVRCAALDDPDVTVWKVDVGGGGKIPPLPIGRLVCVLVDGGLAAIER